MLLSLSALLETCFKLINPRTNNQTSYIGIRCSHYHVRYIIFMSWSIKNSPPFLLGYKRSFTYLYSLTSLSLFLIHIHAICKPPWISSFILRFLLILSNFTFIDLLSGKHYITTYCTLSYINMPNKYDWTRFSRLIHFMNLLIFVLTNYIFHFGRKSAYLRFRRRFWDVSRLLCLIVFDITLVLL